MRILIPILVACSSSAPPVAKAPPPPPPKPVPAPAPPDPLVAKHNFDFEQHDGDKPTGWRMFAPGFEVHSDADQHHGGERSLRVQSSPGGGGEFGATGVAVDAKPYIGKRLRIHGWVKTATVSDGASLWVRIDGGTGGLDNMEGRRASGTTGWTEQVAEIDVLDGAEQAFIGGILVGTGTAWFDDLRVEVVEAEKVRDIVLEGVVVDPAGAPAAGAEVSLIVGSEIHTHVKTDAAGKFQFATRSGRLGLSAHRAGAVGVFQDQESFKADRRDLRLVLGKDGGVTVHGQVTPKTAAGTYLQVSPLSKHDADVFAVPIAADGSFEIVMPRGDQYNIEVLDGAFMGGKVFPRTGDRVEATLALGVLGPPPAEVVDYIGKQGIPLTTPEAGHGLADMEPIAKLIGNARVVALGEATHGTREFFQLKHRFLEYLVAKQRFTIFAIEANQPECRAINDYVVDGKGDAKKALGGIYFWTWNTEEVLAMIEWMRAWNADPKHTAKVQFTGFDMQTSTVAAQNVEAFLRERVPTEADKLVAPIAVLAKRTAMDLVQKQSPDERADVSAGLHALATRFDMNKKAWSAAAGAARFADVRHDVTVLEQAFRLYSANQADRTGFDVRDESMAANVGWLLEQQPRARMMIWAHNGHISNTLVAFNNMGSHLRKQLGTRYLNLGFVFGEGSFQAINFGPSGGKGLQEFTVGPPPESHASVAFSRTGKPLLVLDLRALPKQGPVRDWFSGTHPIREIGAGFASDKAMTQLLVLPELYDAVIFVDKTTRARPIPPP